MRHASAVDNRGGDAAPSVDSMAIDFGEVFSLLNANRVPIALAVAGSIAIAAAYLVVTPKQYTATALLLIDSRSNNIPVQQMRVTDANSESAYVETQVSVLKSERILRTVIVEKRLYERPEFGAPSRIGAWAAPIGSLGGDSPVGAPPAVNTVSAGAVKEFRKRIDIRRNPATYIIEINVTMNERQAAADTANAIAHAYLADRLRSREQAIRSASQWLQQRVRDLRRETQIAETSLDEFRNSGPATNNSRTVLRDLESTAQTYRLISESFMKRFLETSQEQYFSPLDARIVSEAVPPGEKSYPRTTLTLAIAAAVGLAIGFLIALVRGVGDLPRSPDPA